MTGAILHDIGKTEELSYSRSFGYSSEGQLLGHIVIGLRIVGGKLDQLPEFPRRLRTLVEHMIISHHGELEFGSPKVPVFPEAMLLHHLDNLDSKMDAMRNALKRDHHVEGEFTGWVAPLERILLKKERFLDDRQPKTAPPLEPAAEPVAEAVANPHDGQPATEAHSIPGTPVASGPERHPAPPDRKPDHRPVTNTLFGEKLQAVLQPRK